MSVGVVWTVELTTILIGLYRDQPALWNMGHPDYKSKIKRRDAWKTLSDVMGIHVLEVTKKIRSITTQFFRELRKSQKKDSMRAPRWFAFERLLFLKERRNLSVEVEVEVEDNMCETLIDCSSEDTPWVEVNEKRNSTVQDGDANKTNENEEETILSSGCSTSSDTEKNEKALNRMIPIMDRRPPNTYLVHKHDDSTRHRFRIFGELVAAKLEALNSTYAQHMAEHLISNVLFEASTGKFDYPMESLDD